MKTETENSVDKLMHNVATTLVRDFRSNLADPSFCSSFYEEIKRENIAGIREACPVTDDTMDVPTFKAVHQVGHLLKRYRFSKDLYSDDELTERAISSFRETQTRIRGIQWNSLSITAQRALDLARVYISRTLGKYHDEEHRDLCRFGKRASVGISAKKACEAERWELPLTGSQGQITWFDAGMRHIDCVQEYWIGQLESDPQRSIYREVDFLTLALVPKTFKSLRSIMPNTTIGSYMSYGLGELMRKRLKRMGYDIRTLQQRHKMLARRASEHGLFTTADLSSASDSISVALVDRLFPSDWVDVLTQSRIGAVQLPDGTKEQSETFCTMGIGYTFPLQTLVFLSLLKAIHFLVEGRRSRGTISVYGDDMIYISQIHGTVCSVFKELGFVINLDKTFHEGYFRESCGGDYYHGMDVRPFCPQSGSAIVGLKTYEAVLYKLVNGFMARWSEYEISETLRYLLSEIGRIVGRAKLVPRDFPDDSGIKVSLPVLPAFLQGRTDVSLPKHIGHGVFRFSYLRIHSDLREEKRHVPYLWLALRGLQSSFIDDWRFPGISATPVQSRINMAVGVLENVPFLIWKEDEHQSVRSKTTGRRLRRMLSFVTVSHSGKYKRQSGTSCFGAP